MRAESMSVGAVELELFMANDGELYRRHWLPVVLNLQRKYDAGTFAERLAVKAMRHAVDAAARAYHAEFGTPGDRWFSTFSVGDRDAVAVSQVRRLLAEWQLGNRWAA